MLIDSHCHFNSLSQEDIDKVVSSSENAVFIDSSIDYQSTQKSIILSKQHSFIYTSAGFHPFTAGEYTFDVLKKYKEAVNENKKVVAVGEIGLDSGAKSSLVSQEAILREFIKLAYEKELPILIHNRLDDHRILNILDDFYNGYEWVVFHCFSYGEDFLDKILAKGGMVSFSLNVLRNKENITASLKKCPLKKMLLETDSPYMRIKKVSSTPLDIEKVYRFTADVKGIPIKDLEEVIYANARRIFRLEIK